VTALGIEEPTEPAEEDARPASSRISIVIAAVMVIATLRLGRALLLPVAVALLLTLTLSAPVRWLTRRRVPGRVAAALVVLGAFGVAIGAASMVVSPAVDWVVSTPATIKTLETRVRQITTPFTALKRSADRMQAAAAPAAAGEPRTVQLATRGLFAQLSFDSLAAIPVALSVVFLTYFLLSNEPLVRRKLAGLLPGRQELERREHLLAEIEVATSRFLVAVTLVNVAVGAVTALALWAVGVPNPVLFGTLAAVLNFVPYLGPLVTTVIITLTALASIPSTSTALIAPAIFVGVHLTESNVVTPWVLGRHLPVNTVAMFLGLLFFGWMWGIPGAVLAVPLTVCAKLVCDHIPTLAHVGALLDS
jgi:predicted PurR-regulated permease PerM